MKLEEILIRYNNQYFTVHDVAGDGNCYYRSVCLSPVIPITDQCELRTRLCTGLRNILKCPLSEEYKLVTSYYSHSEDSKKVYYMELPQIQNVP